MKATNSSAGLGSFPPLPCMQPIANSKPWAALANRKYTIPPTAHMTGRFSMAGCQQSRIAISSAGDSPQYKTLPGIIGSFDLSNSLSDGWSFRHRAFQIAPATARFSTESRAEPCDRPARGGAAGAILVSFMPASTCGSVQEDSRPMRVCRQTDGRAVTAHSRLPRRRYPDAALPDHRSR